MAGDHPCIVRREEKRQALYQQHPEWGDPSTPIAELPEDVRTQVQQATGAMRTNVDFTDSYYRTPARFVAKRDSAIEDPLPERLEGKKVAVAAGTAHEAYLKALFTEAEVRPYPSADAARLALRRGDVDLLFGDAITLAFWLNGTDSENCCAFRGGPYIDGRYFGEGVGIAVKKGNDTMRLALNWALFRVWEQGRFTDLWLRYFPVSPF